MMRNLAPLLGLVGLMALPVSAQNGSLVEAGKNLYASKKCARCHMVAGKGYKDGKLDGVASKVSSEDMRKWLTAPREMEAKLEKRPKVRMSSRKNMTLTEAEVSALVAYLMTLK